MTIMGETTVDHARRQVIAEYGEDFSPGPGKFEGEDVLTYALWNLSMESGQDQELGDVDGFGWYALFAREAVILHTDSVGFVYGTEFDTESEAVDTWSRLETEYEEYLDDTESEAV